MPLRRVLAGLRTLAALTMSALVTVPLPAAAQTPLSLEEAMARARAATPAARALSAAAAEAAERVREARAGYLPRFDVTESIQRGDQPVFVFSSLLSQRQFAASNFDIATLNHPNALTNTRTLLSLEQRLFDGGRTRHAVRVAEIGRDMADWQRTGSGQDLAMTAAESFVRVLQLEAAERATQAAADAAESDVARARARRDAGLVTEADALAAEVHLADMRQRQIATSGELAVARLALNDVVGLPLDERPVLAMPAPRVPAATDEGAAADVRAARADWRQAELQVQAAGAQRELSRLAFLPTVGVQAAWDFNGSTLPAQRSGWLVGAQVQLNLFNGFADSARGAAARQGEARAIAERDRLAGRINVELRSAAARLEAARARDAVGRAALAQARESQRIIRERYDSGLATITDVLRAAESVLDAESRATAAEMDVILQAVALSRAEGRL